MDLRGSIFLEKKCCEASHTLGRVTLILLYRSPAAFRILAHSSVTLGRIG
jgi:hypothetical protein